MSKPKKVICIDIERCKGCGLCVSVCPKQVLAMAQDEMNTRGYHPAEKANPQSCILCGMCTIICPDLAILMSENEQEPEGTDSE